LSNRAYLGFDYGTKSIGVAVGQSETRLAQPLGHVRVRAGTPDWDTITQLIAEWRPDALVVGLPLNMDDSENALTQAATKFGNRLSGRYNLRVHFVDERLTSVMAKSALLEAGIPLKHANKNKIDALSAQILLQAFLDDGAGTAIR